jgi:serine/threonine protein kinase
LKAIEALNYVHSQKVYYGDMKPQNLLVFRDMSIKLGDFGVSVKVPDNQNFDEEDLYIKGLTYDFSNKNITQKFHDDQRFSFKELIQNDYYSLYKSFENIKHEFDSKLI